MEAREAVRGSAWCSEKQDIKLAEIHQIPLEHRKPFKMSAMRVGSGFFPQNISINNIK